MPVTLRDKKKSGGTSRKAEAKADRKAKGKGRESKATATSPHRREFLGLFLLAICLVTVIALLSEFMPTRNGNILGPWLGQGWAGALNLAFGRLPILLYIAAAAVAGYGQVTGKLRLLWRPLLLFVIFGFTLGALLSVHLIGHSPISDLELQAAGGHLGSLFIVSLLGPLFGQTQFGPYLLLGLFTLFLLVWGFRLSVAAWMERGAERAGALGLRVVDGFRSGKADADSEEDGEEEGYPQPLALSPPYAPVGLGKPTKASPVTPPLPKGKPGEASNAGSRGIPASTPVKAAAKAATPAASEMPIAIPEVVDELTPEELEQLAKLDPSEMDPLLVRKLRDLQLERQRVTELNEWEQKVRSPEISGMLGGRAKKPPSPESVAVTPGAPVEALPGDAEDLEEAEASLAKRKGKAIGTSKSAKAGKGGDAMTASGAPVVESGWDNTPREITADEDEEIAEDVSEGETAEIKAVPAPKPAVKYDAYRLPSLNDIFPEPPKQPLEFTEEELRDQSKMLEAQLINFKVMGKVTQICPGPVITRYEVELAPGVKVNRIAGLADDLALALRAKSIRILAPIPGKSVVGIEVPNRKAQVVYIKEILASPEFGLEEDSLKVGLGKTIGGEPYVMDLTRAPHLLIAGQTGSGKSVCINSIMASLLASKTPDDLRMILVDPKVVELKPYDEIPHLLHPVITQPDIAVQALKWATVEMDRRYEVLAQSGVRNIKGFNQRCREGRLPEVMAEEDRTHMPYILIVIDELADLMMVAGKEVETSIARIAQKARAVGIHLLLATQRPSTNVITGTIKANLPTRIAFQVASQIDARTIMDKQGAEKLLGRGDMLYKAIDFPEPVRLHGCYIDDEQCEKIAGACSGQFVNYPQVKTFNLDEDSRGGAANDEPRDEMFRDAAELVVQLKQASVSLLQRRLGIGYARSGRLVDQLERAGIVGRERGSKPREVLMNEEELQSFLSSGLNDE